jgi:hypothetical protein
MGLWAAEPRLVREYSLHWSKLVSSSLTRMVEAQACGCASDSGQSGQLRIVRLSWRALDTAEIFFYRNRKRLILAASREIAKRRVMRAKWGGPWLSHDACLGVKWKVIIRFPFLIGMQACRQRLQSRGEAATSCGTDRQILCDWCTATI